jgi:hypothetical protein
MRTYFPGIGVVAALVVLLALPGTAAVDASQVRVAGQGTDVCVRSARERARPESARKAYGAAIVASQGRPKWIFGLSTAGRSPGRPLALRWNGTAWRDTSVPWRAAVSGLVGGDVEGSEAWAVGFVRPVWSFQPIVGHWRGGRWRDVHVAPLPRIGATLTDVEALERGRVVVVGTAYRRGRARAIALQRIRGTWRSINPVGGARESSLLAITEGPDGQPWAVGWQLRGGEPRPLVVSWTGSRWQVGSGAALDLGSAILTDIAFRPNGTGWAVGYQVERAGERHRALLQRWDGATWKEVNLPWAAGRSMVPRAVALRPGGDIAITGFTTARNRTREVGFVATRRADVWTVLDVGQPSQRHWEMMDVAPVGTGFVTVGGVSNALVARSVCGQQSTPEASLSATPVVPPVGIRDVAHGVGRADSTLGHGTISADFDRDGWTDLFIGRHTNPPLLMMGGPNGFHRRRLSFPDRDYHGCAAADVDRDRLLDIYCTIGANHGYISKANTLWLHPGRGRRLQHAASSMGVIDTFGRGRRATFLNLNGDRYPDLFVVNEHERVDGLPSRNRMFRNLGGDQFAAAPRAGVDLSMGGVCAEGADLDRDGDDELLVCSSVAWGGRRSGLRVFWNDRGRMREVSRRLGIQPAGDVDVVVTDLNDDGRPDIVRLSPGTLRVHLGTASGFRTSYRRSVSDAAAIAAGDANGDGRPDLYVAQGVSSGRNDLLLINRGTGRSFRAQVVPGTSRGRADDVVALDHDRNGLVDFLIVNGNQAVEPIQLIAAFRR